jgi:UDPglucose 6-dehydrogenase
VTLIAVVGTGYVGLSTGVGLADLGHEVTCVDIDANKISILNSGRTPIAEAGMDDAIGRNLASKNISFSVDVQGSVRTADFVFLCLPTPQADDGSADMSFIFSACQSISSSLKKNAVLVNKSTVPVGSASLVKSLLQRDDISVVSNPEFLRQGTALHDFLNPSRVVIGSDDQYAAEKVAELYSKVKAPILKMNAASAEALKYAANSFLATKLTFVNAIADICELVGADIFDVVEGLGLDSRIGSQFLNPGPGWGGSCFPKDTRALVKIAEENGYDFALLRGVIQTNDGHYERVAQRIIDSCDGVVDNKTLAVWGLTFKAHTDDLRDSPSIAILTILNNQGMSVKAYDPSAKGPYASIPWVEVCTSPIEACRDADVLAVLTEWPEFSVVEPTDVAEVLLGKHVIDGRNVLNREKWMSAGFTYRGVGR